MRGLPSRASQVSTHCGRHRSCDRGSSSSGLCARLAAGPHRTYKANERAGKSRTGKAGTGTASTATTNPADSLPAGANKIPFIIAIAAILGIFAYYSWRTVRNENAQLKRKLSTAESEARDLEILYDNQKKRAGDLEQILTLAGKPGTAMARLWGQPIAPDASGAVFWDMEGNRCLILGYFPRKPEGKIYQLWFITRTEKIPVEPLEVLSRPVEIAVTLEPDNGSKIPTLPIYATARIE